ncbi:MAG TPA: hypothetical protein VJN39_12045 [Gemmatimonadales bacterium]|nr:hypothetical protein [Gemmatimonadales bacterium]
MAAHASASGRVLGAILLTTCVTAPACYNYTHLTTPDPRPGAYLALTLTDAGSDSLTRYLGPNVLLVRGRYRSTDGGAFLVSVTSVETREGLQDSWAGETVRIPIGSVASCEMRQLAKGRSALLAGASVVGVVAAAAAFGLKPGGGGNIYTPPGLPTSQ